MGDFMSKAAYLQHYGVLGMKWGVRRSAGRTSRAKSKIQQEKAIGAEDVKEWREIGANKNKNVSSNISKSRQITKKRIDRQERKISKEKNKQTVSKRTQKAVNSLSTGEKIAKAAMLGNYGGLVYTSLRSKGVKKGRSVATAVLNETLNNLSFGALSRRSRW